MSEIAQRYYFSGQVQGVGFRYKTTKIASAFAITGYVRNLDDGRVELFVEGEGKDIEGFVRAIKTYMEAEIQSVEQEDASLEKWNRFDVRS